MTWCAFYAQHLFTYFPRTFRLCSNILPSRIRINAVNIHTLPWPPSSSLSSSSYYAKWSKVPGLYTAVSKDGTHWSQLEPEGEPAVIGAYGNPGIMPPLVSANASNVPSGSGGGKTVCGTSKLSNFVYGAPHMTTPNSTSSHHIQ